MKTIGEDKIFAGEKTVKHESAGGFLFFEDPKEGLLVAIIKKIDDTYYMPKGHIKDKETPEEAATRELTEELSLKVKPKLIKKVGVDSYRFTLPNDLRKHLKNVHIYIFEVNNKAKIAPATDEGFEDAKWVSIPNALKMLAFDAKNLEKSKEAFLESKK